MFRVSKRVFYGYQLMAALASESQNQPVATATLAARLNIPLPFLHQIAHSLMQAGLLKALPGPRGGVRLNRSAGEITVLSIVNALEGKIELQPGEEKSSTNSMETPDTTCHVWEDLEGLILQFLGEKTLEPGGSPESSPFSLGEPEAVEDAEDAARL